MHFYPLDQEVWEYFCFDSRWVFELQVTGTELDVPFGDSASCSGVVEDVREWCAAHDRDEVLVEVMCYFP